MNRELRRQSLLRCGVTRQRLEVFSWSDPLDALSRWVRCAELSRCALPRSPLRRRTLLRRLAAWLTAANGHAEIALTKTCLPSTRSTLIEHRESTPRLGPLTSAIRTVMWRIRRSNRRRDKDSRCTAYSRNWSTVSACPARIRNSIGCSIGHSMCVWRWWRQQMAGNHRPRRHERGESRLAYSACQK